MAIEPLGDLAAARPVWERLERATENPFATWMFAEQWWRCVGAGRKLRLSAVRVDGQVAALLPVYEAEDTLRLIGHGDADLLGPVCSRDVLPVALRALRELAAGAGQRLVADELPGGSHQMLGGEVLRRTSSPVLDIGAGGYEGVLRACSPKHRRAVRTRERRLVRAYDVHIRTADAESLTQDLETLFALHRARWGGTTSVFSGPRRAMHAELALRALERGWLRLRLLELDGRPVAATYGFRVGDAEWFYQTGRHPAAERWSVGKVLLGASIRLACDEGAARYRLLRGDQPYKLSWASRDAPVETVLLPAP